MVKSARKKYQSVLMGMASKFFLLRSIAKTTKCQAAKGKRVNEFCALSGNPLLASVFAEPWDENLIAS